MNPTIRNRMRQSAFAFACALAGAAPSMAAEATPSVAAAATARAEIDHLLQALQASGCSFQRNGRWHDAGDARKHLARKRDYIEKRTTITSTETFIAEAASRSSLSGKPYQVRCGNSEPVGSALWLQRALDDYRRRATR